RLRIHDYVGFFDSFALLSNRVRLAIADPGTHSLPAKAGVRTLDEYNAEVLGVLMEVLDSEVDRSRLERRWNYLLAISEHQASILNNDVGSTIAIFGLSGRHRLGDRLDILVSVESVSGKRPSGRLQV